MNRFDAVIMDFGDTLATLKPSKEEIARGFLLAKGFPLSLEVIKTVYRMVDYSHKQSAINLKKIKEKEKFLIQFNRELFKVLGLADASKNWAEELFSLFKEKKNWVLFPEIIGCLEKIKLSGMKAAVLANWDIHLKALVKNLRIEIFFSEVVSSQEIGIEKPDPKIFLYLLERMGIQASMSLYVGNEYETDVIGSRGAGMTPVLIDRYNFWPVADCTKFKDMANLISWLKL